MYRLVILILICGAIHAQCPDAWVAYNNSCYFFSHENVQFNEAENICLHHGSDLVHVDNLGENLFLKSFVSKLKVAHHWLGLTDKDAESVWQWCDDMTTATFTDWYRGQPDGGTGSNCVNMLYNYKFQWSDVPCTRQCQPICEKHMVQVNCPDGWVVFGDSCYLFSHENVHFTEAENFCRQHGVHLLHVDTPTENIFIKSVLRNLLVADHWLGLTDQVIDGLWKWYDTDNVATFTDWAPGQPDQGIAADCAVFAHAYDFKWVDEPCSSKNYKPICEKKREVTVIVG